ncbi:MAG: methyltransferase [Prevotella sp.]|nr:methyltransferase [Prevotella sp.]
MPNEYFQFRQFTVWQDRCAMKVGTDGTLLGAWSQAPIGECRILDIGTGTGLVALMMAQRFPNAQITAIDIDGDAVMQAQDNVKKSPFSSQIKVVQGDIRNMVDDEGFDAIVSNPPYFVDSLACPDLQRTTARHTISLSYKNLITAVDKLLKSHGLFSVILPEENLSNLEIEANVKGLFPRRIFHVHTTPRKNPKRCLIEFSRISDYKTIIINDVVLEDAPNVRSEWYHQLTQNFYIK